MKSNIAALLALTYLAASAASAATLNSTVQRNGANWVFAWTNLDPSCDVFAFDSQRSPNWVLTIDGTPVTAIWSGLAYGGGSGALSYTAPNGILTEATRNGDHFLTCGTDTLALPGFAAPAVTVSPAAAANPQVGVAYSQALTAGGGFGAPYSYVLQSGALPAGLSLNMTTGEISGTPTAAGPASFTVRVLDNGRFFVDQAYSVTTAAAAVIAPSQPASIPTLSEWGLILTSAMVGLLGFAWIRRQS